MDLVGIVERTVVDIQLLVGPGIAVGHAHLAVGVAPVALAPVGGVVADSGMGHGSSENIGLGLKIFGHESAVRSAQATHVMGINETVVGAELFCSFDDVLCHSLTGRVDMA